MSFNRRLQRRLPQDTSLGVFAVLPKCAHKQIGGQMSTGFDEIPDAIQPVSEDIDFVGVFCYKKSCDAWLDADSEWTLFKKL